ncbi:hypothetical protein BDW74DRAFT_155262 [Aspergillus multicolor]|uniref:uncharacterized protein n=1 Tax=Aspergillus multicolor TaxID=41759 RepID=UPI003CCD8657
MASFSSEFIVPGRGAIHANEVPEVFGTYPFFYWDNNTQYIPYLSGYMRDTWAAFAKDPDAGPQSRPKATESNETNRLWQLKWTLACRLCLRVQ